MRLSSILLSTAFLAASGAAWAQTPPPAADAPPPPPPAMAQSGETPPPPPAMAQPGGMPPPHMMGGHGPHGGMSSSTGFHLRMGEDRELKVECGDMPLAECIETARPLMDMAGN